MLEMSLDKLKHETTHRLIRVYLCNVHSLSWYIPFQAVYHLRIAHLNLQTQITFKFHVVENICIFISTTETDTDTATETESESRYLIHLKHVYGTGKTMQWEWLAFFD